MRIETATIIVILLASLHGFICGFFVGRTRGVHEATKVFREHSCDARDYEHTLPPVPERGEGEGL